jgi:hypothetical protein
MATVGCVALMLMNRRVRSIGAPATHPETSTADPETSTADAPASSTAEASFGEVLTFPVQTADDAAVVDEASDPAEQKLEELAEIRAGLVSNIDRRALFAMARDRGLPHYQIFFMTSKQLLDAIIDTEGLPPFDVLPSTYTEERMDAIAAEAHRRHEQIMIAEAAERHAG